ncbi:MAG: hypothetical protein ACLR1D_01425 [Dialister sp.]
MKKIFCPLGISAADIAAAQNAGEEAVRNYKNALRKETERILKEIEKINGPALFLPADLTIQIRLFITAFLI